MFKFNKEKISKITATATERKVNEKRANKKLKRDFKITLAEIKAKIKYEAKLERNSLDYFFHYDSTCALENAIVEKLKELGFDVTLKSCNRVVISW